MSDRACNIKSYQILCKTLLQLINIRMQHKSHPLDAGSLYILNVNGCECEFLRKNWNVFITRACSYVYCVFVSLENPVDV